MSKIFISHSGINNAHALAVAQWLTENGWNEYFLNVDAMRGLAPGVGWQEELKRAANRCEAVLFLISPAWRDSRWCLAEFLLAKQLGKAVFGVLIEATPLDTLPPEMSVEYQLCDLVHGASYRTFRVFYDPVVPETEVSLAEAGLKRLKLGLQRSRLDPSYFPWPPPNDPERAPYRGLRALEAEDAAVFFGREAAILRGLDALRAVREQGVQRMFVILGASGSGKSSFLRAGLLPRLARDDLHFLPLPVIRSERAAITGTSGLVASLARAFEEHDPRKTRAAIRAELQAPRGLVNLLRELRELARSRVDAKAPAPTVVIPIDQGEELARTEGRAEAEAFLSMLAQALSPLENDDMRAQDSRHLALAVVAIRSDSYEQLQTEPSLQGVTAHLSSLPAMPRVQFKAVIEEPAARATAAGRSLTLEPDLTEQLLKDAEGADALPLLAFTLERLYVEYRGEDHLRLDHYQALGGVCGSIEAAVDAAFDDPGQRPVIPADKAEREGLLRQAFVPWLAGVDPQTEERKRRVARWEEFPAPTHPLLERLIAARLLVRDRRKVEDGEEEILTVEVAHEALLRQWPTLTTWLDADADDLKTLGSVQRLADEWVKNGRTDAWLAHTGERLATAERIRYRADFDQLLGVDGAAYLQACRRRDDAARQEREAQLQRVARAQRRVAAMLALIAIVLAVFAAVGWYQADAIATQRDRVLGAQSKALSFVSRERTDKGFATLGVLLALEALPQQDDKDRPFVQSAEAALLTALLAQREKFVLTGHTDGINQVVFSPRSGLLVTVSRDGTARLLNADSGAAPIVLRGHERQVYAAEFSQDGGRVVTASADGTARLWSTESGDAIFILRGHEGDVYQASLSSDGHRIVTASHDVTARVWSAETGQMVCALQGHAGPVWAASFSPDGGRVVTASDDRTSKVWNARTGVLLATLRGHSGAVLSAEFSSDGRRIVTASWDHTGRLWDASTGRTIATLRGHRDGVGRAAFSPDGNLIATASADGSARLWDGVNGILIDELVGHKGQVYDAHFSPDGRRLVTAGDDGTARLWDMTDRNVVHVLHGHTGRVWSAVFSSDGLRIATGSEDGTARVWGAVPAVAQARLNGHTAPLHRAFFSSDGERLFTACADGTIGIWNGRAGSRTATLASHEGALWYAVVSRDGRRLVATASNGTASLWDIATGELMHTLRGHRGLVKHAHFSPDGQYLVTAGSEGTVQAWEVGSGRTVAVLRGHTDAVNFAEFSHTGGRILSASQDGTARIWDAHTGAIVAVLTGHEGPVINGAFSKDDRRVITTSWDRTARLWDAATGQALSKLTGHTDAVLSAEFSPDGQSVVTASSDNTARTWDVASGKGLLLLPDQEGEVYAASFSPDGRLILTASGDGSARLWHAGSGLLVARLRGHRGPVISATFAADGRHMATASWDHAASLWTLPVATAEDWTAYARKTLPRRLNEDEARLYLE